MKNNESRFSKKKKSTHGNRKVKHLKNKQDRNSLDSFVRKENIFDDEFSREDFLMLTKKWKEENLKN